MLICSNHIYFDCNLGSFKNLSRLVSLVKVSDTSIRCLMQCFSLTMPEELVLLNARGGGGRSGR